MPVTQEQAHRRRLNGRENLLHRPAFQTSLWHADHLRALGDLARNTIPLIDPAANPPILPGIDLWDLLPLQQADGSSALFDGASLWFVLYATAVSYTHLDVYKRQPPASPRSSRG